MWFSAHHHRLTQQASQITYYQICSDDKPLLFVHERAPLRMNKYTPGSWLPTKNVTLPSVRACIFIIERLLSEQIDGNKILTVSKDERAAWFMPVCSRVGIMFHFVKVRALCVRWEKGRTGTIKFSVDRWQILRVCRSVWHKWFLNIYRPADEVYLAHQMCRHQRAR